MVSNPRLAWTLIMDKPPPRIQSCDIVQVQSLSFRSIALV